MKISLALGPRQPISPQTAWGCLTTNLALPGFGSLMAGRVIGYAQAALGIGGLVLTLLFGARFVVWSLAHWSELHGAEADSLAALGAMWMAVRWALLGIVVFLAGWLWALGSSLQILRLAKSANARLPAEPPRLL